MVGGKQEFGIRPGTENLPAICGFVEAAEIVCSKINEENKRTKEINKRYRKLLAEKIEDIIINTSVENSSPYILNVSIANVLGEVLIRYLEKDEIYLSTGAACSSGVGEKSNRVMKSNRKKKKR